MQDIEGFRVSRRTALKWSLAGLAATGLAGGLRSAAADTLADIKKRGELVVATEMQFPPFDISDNGVYKGVDRELIDAVAKELGVKVSYLDLPWTSVLPGLEAKKFDLVIAPVTITKERMKRYAFSVPIADATASLMKRADDKTITKPEDLAGKTVGGQKGTAQVAQFKEFAAKLPKPVEVKEYVDNNQSYADLAAGRIDAAINSLPNLAYAASQRPEAFALVLPPFGQPTYFSWVARPDDQSLIEAVNAAIVKLDGDGTMAKIQTTWFGQPTALPTTVPEPKI
ncbi:amino acid ABC transporter substrate-binding protein (PAAT family) [Roseiarcus fermentans]|uniref:Amino acid ABC transporter substrate-binding protein (PAAT family) n=1 Tax=Roseiarcus fermentans TaxID=1473586 RepID=A0A366FV57_9HYPH|nr:transporter substrate-binding domain-containing protein [Roseiarcus fermentans]RBP18391.1 amino acid ABC transporter substrate-binding protein (PAAT family) [Roseiarcus fermentans]